MSRRVSLEFLLHQGWRHFGLLLEPKLTVVRYQVSNDFLVCLLTPVSILKCSFCGLFSALKSSRIIFVSSMFFIMILDLQKGRFGEPLGVPRDHLMSFQDCCFMFWASFLAAFQHLLKKRGGGRGGESTVP